ncbi:hypothetical protein TcasGA2_TC008082 [Tribolium castaneum]|uniref:Uncharacterized protein n=1 Tax=Tribolium castaneum TaxID=7070 RepID=D1ZZQ4_TRICA|nr:hypothetical protein TcasGA2_TC008082 [Tribolium castaneum]
MTVPRHNSSRTHTHAHFHPPLDSGLRASKSSCSLSASRVNPRKTNIITETGGRDRIESALLPVMMQRPLGIHLIGNLTSVTSLSTLPGDLGLGHRIHHLPMMVLTKWCDPTTRWVRLGHTSYVHTLISRPSERTATLIAAFDCVFIMFILTRFYTENVTEGSTGEANWAEETNRRGPTHGVRRCNAKSQKTMETIPSHSRIFRVRKLQIHNSFFLNKVIKKVH